MLARHEPRLDVRKAKGSATLGTDGGVGVFDGQLSFRQRASPWVRLKLKGGKRSPGESHWEGCNVVNAIALILHIYIARIARPELSRSHAEGLRK